MAWAATQAKAKFSEVLDKAETEGPQLVRRRKREFFVLTREQRDALAGVKSAGLPARKTSIKGRRTTAEFFENSPSKNSGIDLKRVRNGSVDAERNMDNKKPFVSAWDALAPSFDERYDIEFPRLKGKLRKADLG